MTPTAAAAAWHYYVSYWFRHGGPFGGEGYGCVAVSLSHEIRTSQDVQSLARCIERDERVSGATIAGWSLLPDYQPTGPANSA